MPTQVKSPYNFVPAPDENSVYKPTWANQVSHDIPFSDGESGELTLKITAETPVFIRNGHGRETQDNEFSHVEVNGARKYFIPATSLKGMFRNVLEIMSLSRMQQINDHRHSVRQIMESNSVMKEGYELSKDEEKKKIECGYLIREGEQYFIYGCEKLYKIRYTELDRKLETNFGAQFESSLPTDINNEFGTKTGKYKYVEILKNEKLEYDFEIHPLDGEDENSWKSVFQHLDYARFSSTPGSFKGRIVCVGQATPYSISTARKGEYVFKGAKAEVISDLNREKMVVSKEAIETFLFINRNGESDELEDWTYWKNQITTGIPVFFRKKKGTNEVKDLGLTFMYKQPVLHSVKEANPEYVKNSNERYRPDLAETIFGAIHEKLSLKGRVMISHCKAVGNPVVLDEQSVLLASPKSSFTPFYLQQNGSNGRVASFNTYNSNPRLRGFKRYPVRNTNRVPNTEGLSQEMLSHFSPLDRNTIFEGKVRFHNLRKIEVGALLSSITLHNTPKVYHSLGGVKPYGYGRVSVEITKINGLKFALEDYLKEFEYEMKDFSPKWTVTVNELIKTSSLQNGSVEAKLEYMAVTDFQKLKIEGNYLPSYSEITNSNARVKEYLTGADMVQRKTQQIENERKRLEEIDKLKNQIISLCAENKFAQAIEALKDLSTKKPSNGFSFEKELERIQDIRLEYGRYEEAYGSDDVLISELFLRDYPISTHRNILESHLSRLKATSGIPDRLKSLKDFDMFSKEAPRWLKKLDKDTFEDYRKEFTSILIPLIIKDHEKPKTKRNWEGGFEKSRNWNKVSEWIGVDEAKKIWDQLNKL
jgi:CRISPR-associated protein (TIGR03986 family)